MTAGNPDTAGKLWLLLEPADGNALRRTHPLVATALGEVPWHDTRATMTDARRFAAAYPDAACTMDVRLDDTTDGAELAHALPPRVTRLTLTGDGVTTGVDVTNAARELPPRITELHLELLHSAARPLTFGHLHTLTALTCTFYDYDIAQSGVDDATIASLPPSLRYLDIPYCNELTAAATFAHLPALTTLNCKGTRVGDAALASLSHAGRPSTITALDVSQCTGVITATFAHLPALQVLRATDTRICDAAIASLPPTVTELAITCCRGVTAAATFAHLPALRTLNCADTGVCDAALARLPAGVATLNVMGCNGVTAAATFAHLPALEQLNCADTGVGNATLASMPPTMTDLTIMSCRGVSADATFAHLPALEQLTCNNTGVGDATIASLSSSMTKLDVSRCAVTDDVTFAHLPALTRLDTTLTAVSDAALASLPPTVTALSVGGALTPDASIHHLHALTYLMAFPAPTATRMINTLLPATRERMRPRSRTSTWAVWATDDAL